MVGAGAAGAGCAAGTCHESAFLPSGSCGDFATVKCGPGANVMPARDMTVFNAWNGVSAASLAKVSGTPYDMHANFMGHGYNNTDMTQVWYDSASCIHPNALGHDA